MDGKWKIECTRIPLKVKDYNEMPNGDDDVDGGGDDDDDDDDDDGRRLSL
jgi:hypothetical protein